MKESVLESGGLFSSDDESDRPKRKSKFQSADSDFEPQHDDVIGEGKVQRAIRFQYNIVNTSTTKNMLIKYEIVI